MVLQEKHEFRLYQRDSLQVTIPIRDSEEEENNNNTSKSKNRY
jgi:hypothetical protein